MIFSLFKNVLVFISLFYLTFYIPFALTSYNHYWIKYNCNLHQRCETIGAENAGKAISNLTSFLMHKDDLNNDWKKNEKVHLNEVRVLLDIMFFVAVLAAVALIVFKNKRPKLYKFAVINILVALCFFIVLPNFNTFWRDIFHPFLFDNELWKVTKRDILYYITPRAFFKLTTTVILSSWVILNLLIILFSALYKPKGKKLVS